MTNAIRLAAVSAFAMTFAAGCGGSTTCDELGDMLIDECGFEAAGDDDDAAEVDCSDDTVLACQSQCGLDAGCDIFTVPDDPTDQAYLDAVAAYTDCVTACG